jgi:hypothetical protein
MPDELALIAIRIENSPCTSIPSLAIVYSNRLSQMIAAIDYIIQ